MSEIHNGAWRLADLERRLKEAEAEIKLLRRAVITQDATTLRATRHVAPMPATGPAPTLPAWTWSNAPIATPTNGVFAQVNADFMADVAVGKGATTADWQRIHAETLLAARKAREAEELTPRERMEVDGWAASLTPRDPQDDMA